MLKDYEDFKKEVYKLSTIDLNYYKEKQMKRRIDSLISRHGLKDYDTYINELKVNKELYNEFIEYITINVSEFFRNPSQWEVLQKEIIPILIEREKGVPLKIWSAACSTGDEPYTMAMILNHNFPNIRYKITATDIDKEILDKARAGIYTEKSVQGVPKEYLNKYFTNQNNIYKVKDELKKTIDFGYHNLLKDSYEANFDLIICRNVLIYFTEEAKDLVYTKFSNSLKKGAVLFVGNTEQIIMANQYNFNPIRTFFYEKQN